MRLFKGISVIIIALGIIFLPTQLSSGHYIITDTLLASTQTKKLSITTSLNPTLVPPDYVIRAGIPTEVEGSQNTSSILHITTTLELPFKASSNWVSAPANIPSIKWQTGDATTRFAVKDGKFISTSQEDTWFIYGWFGAIESITKDYNIKYPRWGNKHNGIDFAGQEGLDIISASGGVVVFTGNNIGNTVIINTKDNYQITYGHLLDISIKTGDIIKTGDLIGHLGNTGTTNPHLHFQIDKIEANYKTAINPLTLLDIDLDKTVIPDADANKFYSGSNNPKLQPNFTWI